MKQPFRQFILIWLGLAVGWFVSPSVWDNQSGSRRTGASPPSLLGSRVRSDGKADVPLRTVGHDYRALQEIALRQTGVGTPDDFGDALEEALRVGHVRNRDTLLNDLFHQWVALAPEEAFEACTKLVESHHRSEAVKVWARQWAHLDTDALLNFLGDHVEPEEPALIGAVIEGLTGAIGVQRPREAMDLMRDYNHFPREGMAAIANADAPAAAAFLRDHVSESHFDFAANAVFGVWAKADPEASVRFFEQMSDSDAERFLKPILDALARAAPEHALPILNHESVTIHHRSEFASDWVRNAPDAALAWAATLDVEQGRDQVIEAIAPLSRLADAAKIFELLQERDQPSSETPAVFRAWVRQDSQAAYEAAMALENPNARVKALEGVLPYLAEHEPQNFQEGLRTLLEDGDNPGISINLTDLLSRLNDHQIASLAEAFPETLNRSIEDVLELRGWSTPDEAVRLADQLPESPGKAKGIQRGVVTWAASDPQAAAAWVETLQPGAGRDGAYQNLINTWSRYDAEAAQTWITGLEAGPGRHVAVEEFIRTNAMKDGAAAWEMAAISEEPQHRLAMQRLALEGWTQADPQAARQALDHLESIPSELETAYEQALETHTAWQRAFNWFGEGE